MKEVLPGRMCQGLRMRPGQPLWKFGEGGGGHPSWGIRQGFPQEVAFRLKLENMAV